MLSFRRLKNLCLATGAALVLGCAPHLGRISSRSPDLFEKESDRLVGGSRGTSEAAAPDIYVKEKRVRIADARPPNETGSLFNPDDERNYLFTSAGPLNVGRFLKVRIAANRGGDKTKDEAAKTKALAAAKAGKDGKDGKGEVKPDAIEAELLKSLPDLEPAAKGEPGLLKSFKMQIVHRYDNGDVLAMVTRKSALAGQAADVAIQARVPYDRLASGDELTTDDLLDVQFNENREGELAERHSSAWEDEYSLRLSGFNEAKSKMAADLGEDKKKLQEASEKLETKIKSFGEERKEFAKQREELTKKKATADDKVKDLEKEVKTQKETIDKQEEQLKDSPPEGKPNDNKEGAGG